MAISSDDIFFFKVASFSPELATFSSEVATFELEVASLRQYLHPFLRQGTRLVTSLGHHRHFYRQLYRHFRWHNSERLA
jgi:hypothetical protein